MIINLVDDGTSIRSLADLPDLPYNYSAATDAPFTRANGWTIDSYTAALPGEQPGPPEPGGPWEVAAQVIKDYAFADKDIIHASWEPDRPLLGRNMLLEGRFLFLQFLFGVRVSKVVEETRQEDGHSVQASGWNYATLKGHLEKGEMGYQVVKTLDTGAVQFRVHRFVKAGKIANPVVRLGFLVFGRFMQVLFVKRSLKQMQRMVAQRTAGAADVHPGIDVARYDEPGGKRTA